jgi:type I restriction enzyme S subunit
MIWKRYPLSELLAPELRPIDVDPTATYREIGIRSHGKGVFHKSSVTGLELGNKKVFAIRPGDFVLNIVFAWEGAVAVAGREEQGCIASHRFPTFRVNQRLVEPQFLLYFFKSRLGLDLLSRVSPGGAGRNRTLNRTRFLEQEAEIPPNYEQRRLIAVADRLSTAIEHIEPLQAEAEKQVDALTPLLTAKLTASAKIDGFLGDVLRSRPRNGWSPRCSPESSGPHVLTLGAVRGFHYHPDEYKRTSEPTIPNQHYWLTRGDLLITRSNTPDLVGHAAIYDGRPAPCIFPDLMMRLTVDESKADVRFVHAWLQTPLVRNYIRQAAKGTSPTMKKITADVVIQIPFPGSLSPVDQRRIVSSIRKVRPRLDEVRQFYRLSRRERSALLPSVLNSFFGVRQ